MLRKITTLAALAGLLGAAPALALPVALYGGNNDNGRFFRVDDLSDGNPMTSIVVNGYNIRGLAYDFANGVMYGGNDNQFFSIDLVTGAQTLVDGSVQYDIQDMVFGPGGLLFGGNDSRFFSIDPATGAMTSILLNPTYGIRGLAFDAQSGLLYGTGGTQNRFYTIDPGTGAQTLIGDMNAMVDAIAIHPETGVMYASLNPILGSGNWYSVDKATGAVTLLGSSPTFPSSGLAFVPEPGTALLLGAGMLGLARFGRRRA